MGRDWNVLLEAHLVVSMRTAIPTCWWSNLYMRMMAGMSLPKSIESRKF
jgi:hypothetical protein